MYLHKRYVAHGITSDQATTISIPPDTVKWLRLIFVLILVAFEVGQSTNYWFLLVLINVPNVNMTTIVN